MIPSEVASAFLLFASAKQLAPRGDCNWRNGTAGVWFLRGNEVEIGYSGDATLPEWVRGV